MILSISVTCAGETGVTCVVNGIVHHSVRKIHEFMMPVVRDLRAAGASVWPLVSPRTVDLRINWERSMMFMKMPSGWHRIPNAADDAERRRLLTDESWRAVARAEWDAVDTGFFPVHDLRRARLVDVTRPEHERFLGRPMTDLVAERGGHPSDVLADWVLDNDLRPGLLCIGMANFDADGVAELLAEDSVLVSSSDAGAHVQMMCAAGDTTLLLTRHVRDRGDFTLERAVWELTGKQADVLGASPMPAAGVAPGHGRRPHRVLRSTSWTGPTTCSSTTSRTKPGACAARRGDTATRWPAVR